MFLGLSNTDPIPEGTAVINGAPTSYGDDLAMRIIWHRDFIERLLWRDPRDSLWILEVAANILLWVWPVTLAWGGLSGYRPRFWRGVVAPTARVSALITASLVTLGLLAALSLT